MEPLEIRLYPNPADNSVTIEFFSNFEEWKIRVFDCHGRLLEAEMPLNKRHIMYIDHYPSGIYIFNLINTKSNEYKAFKVIIDH
ncbi:MAG: T9SS type A sorting domain-containing protein [Bacteroidetes bacterium]|nr:T9SS type A sorting domain-containing protein [Bacteroidota bacterium]